MPKLFNAESGALIAEISAAQLDFLRSEMEEESEADQDYYIDLDMLAVLKEDGAEPELVELLGKALGQTGEMTIRWSE
jgi:hypothetical protein